MGELLPRRHGKPFLSARADSKKWAVIPTALAAVVDIYIARSHPVTQVRQLATAAAVVGLTIIPITGFILPVNEKLLALEKDDSLKGVSSSDPAGKDADELVNEWERRHLIRYVSYIGGWGLSLAALVLGALVLEVNEVVVI